MICIKDVCNFIDVEQGKNQSVQMAGAVAFVKDSKKNLINYSTKTDSNLEQRHSRVNRFVAFIRIRTSR
ncbi:hypothetical protein DUB76_13400 [Salmonella enterica subsp. enterica serovar Derby]|uniref:Uncharacterized protein n=1 Tax=Salmonella derby TaxID=28144 RepID=A0A5X8K527_SALDE|nr:hypothetical protein [Salmonella enterica subsp. enterica serovar Derby]EAB7896323.1 hypothetical protein [Salmonella enterica subsp. enterica serovar Derby]EBR9599726.1 hypothetical protein [Salmonella enterica subsp. enterica serovar Derby]EBR9704822.1 hypothetical protein [Salmonella enterica subsp. enterica serovar Derby]EBS1604166.1 hypothetical protein [Salmonella enterica subsp. enterica serovar Derby]